MHLAQQDFCSRVKATFPEFFRNQRVLDAGSLDINGSNRDLFENSVYTGVDVGPGRNVDIVCCIHEIMLPSGSVDVVVSTECFEHDPHYKDSLLNIVRLLRPGGLFFFTCASTGRPEHGTIRQNPENSPLTIQKGWDHYKNLTELDIRMAVDVDTVFPDHHFEFNEPAGDLYFWGFKAIPDTIRPVPGPVPGTT